jgi:hypothetical protein
LLWMLVMVTRQCCVCCTLLHPGCPPPSYRKAFAQLKTGGLRVPATKWVVDIEPRYEVSECSCSCMQALTLRRPGSEQAAPCRLLSTERLQLA